MVEKDTIWETLKRVQLPGFKDRSVLGLVQSVTVHGDAVTIDVGIAHMQKQAQETIATSIREAVLQHTGAEAVDVNVVPRQTQQPAVQQNVPVRPRYVVAVGSGKGGVGKSTIAVNLAVALAQQGHRVGLMDADVYGPSVPRMLGVRQLPPGQNNQITPAEAYGIKMVSIAFMVDPDKAVVWRGPMLDKIINQFSNQVAWGDLDILVVDLPPGTGDIALSLDRYTSPDGAIVVSTPQGLALDDVRKAVSMFRRLDIPVLGLVENMSYFQCPDCGSIHDLFGRGGGKRLADFLEIPLLGEVPLESRIREGGDDGEPAVTLNDSAAGDELRAVAERVWDTLTAAERVSVTIG